jgi:hypothetical protein
MSLKCWQCGLDLDEGCDCDPQNPYQTLKDVPLDLGTQITLVESLTAELDAARISSMVASKRADHLAEEITNIRIALGKVAVYKEILEYSPTVLAVDDLVRDHEELEARIDAALHHIRSERESRNETVTDIEVARLLKGGTRVPDTIEGIEGD